jgi:D-aminopeptidase
MRRAAAPLLLLLLAAVPAAARPRARELGVPFDGTPGPLDAITDVGGVEVGHTTLISGSGKAAVRTGVTAVLPRGKASQDPVFAGWFTQNGNGEMTGTTWLREGGFLEGPVMITNTHSVGVVRDAVIKWRIDRGFSGEYPWSLPVVAETWDGYLNDINGFHVTAADAFHALDSAATGPVPEGSVGGGTGMVCHELKGGIGTASRKVGDYTVGVLVQCNYGLRRQLRVAGVPVGRDFTEGKFRTDDAGSIIVVIATDAPLLPHQLERLARRATMGIARNGGVAGNGSGDIFVAFSTANPGASNDEHEVTVRMFPNEKLDPLFEATVQATEESIINALVAADTMEGFDGHRVIGLPHAQLQKILGRYQRLAPPRRPR